VGASDLTIRPEQPRDIPSVREVNLSAFPTSAEADLVDALRDAAAPTISLVADRLESVVGHIFFSPVTLANWPDLKVMGLAPMAVAPAWQRQGIGSALVAAGVESCRQCGSEAIVVLGHAGFYPRFGFVPASRFGIGCEYDVTDEHFMALELDPGILTGKPGTIRYHRAFAGF
jgi:putative acetyltransferase